MTTKDHSFRFKGGKVGVLLIHGLCGTPAEMRFIANGLARDGYTVHCPQLAGHGGTRDDVTRTGWRDWYRSAEAALEEIRKDCDTVIVGGLCLGSILGIHLASKHPEKVQGIALFAPTLWLNGWAMPWATRLLGLLGSRRLANLMVLPDTASLGIKCPRVREFVQVALSNADGLGTTGTPAGLVLEHRAMVKEAMKLLGQVKQPTLIMHSLEDDHANIDNAHYLQRNLGGSVDLVELNDSYHMITVDKQRHVVLERTRSFVATLVEQVRTATAVAIALPKAA